MIGVAASPSDLATAAEFFELFKTPWEPAVPGRTYQAVVSAGAGIDRLNAGVFLVYSAAEHETERLAGVKVMRIAGPATIRPSGTALPIYGAIAAFDATDAAGPQVEYATAAGRRVRRIGYDLFAEIRGLLTSGQPVDRASTPTLDLHIDLLRQRLVQENLPFIEIPPRPYGYDFVCCLTHDLDFVGVRRHRFDRTLAGFIGRAALGTAVDVLRRRRRRADVARNWIAVASLPLVFAGVARDFWSPFDDYARADAGRPSTFFVVPFKGQPGVSPEGTTDWARAVAYQASEIAEQVTQALDTGSEVAVHGLDAWRDSSSGRAELREVTALSGRREAGVRMHWLYWTAESPKHLEAAGFEYDSTWGYNEAIGYRAGTSQVFQPPGANRLLELPLSIMDTALFYRARMGVTLGEAAHICRPIVEHARGFGGTVVINWHDRSLAPERLWGESYHELLDLVSQGNRTWFATGAQAVDWFRWRRAVRFDAGASGSVRIIAPPSATALPAARVHVRHGSRAVELRLDGRQELNVPL